MSKKRSEIKANSLFNIFEFDVFEFKKKKKKISKNLFFLMSVLVKKDCEDNEEDKTNTSLVVDFLNFKILTQYDENEVDRKKESLFGIQVECENGFIYFSLIFYFSLF